MAAVLSFISTTRVPKLLNRRRLESDSKATATRHQLIDSHLSRCDSGIRDGATGNFARARRLQPSPGVDYAARRRNHDVSASSDSPWRIAGLPGSPTRAGFLFCV